MNRYTLGLGVLALALASPLPAGAADTSNNYQQQQQSALAAFKRGDYAEALRGFDQVYLLGKRQGQASASLAYNRAVCLFKLQRLTEAQAAFGELAQRHLTGDQQQWTELAHYNLALIAQSQGNSALARAEFRLLAQSATNARLKLLAERQLAAADAAQTTATSAGKSASPRPATKSSALLLSLALTSDDNAGGFADELASELTQAGDTYLTALAYGHNYLSGQAGSGVKLYGLAQKRSYQRFSSFDTQVLGAGADSEFKYADWNLSLGGRWLNTQVDGAALYRQLSLLGKAGRGLAGGRLDLSYSGSHFSAGDNYGYLDGWQHQLRTSWTRKAGAWQFSPSLGWEANSRSDKRTDTQFFSYSPQFFSLGLGLKYNLGSAWQVYAQGDLTRARYAGTNKMKDLGDQEKQQQRDYTRTNLLLGARYLVSRHWQLKGEYSHIASDDTFALYSYDKQLLNLKLDYLW